MTVYRHGPELDNIVDQGIKEAIGLSKQPTWKSISSVKKESMEAIDPPEVRGNPHGWECPCDDCDNERKEVLKREGVLPTARPRPRYTDDEIDDIVSGYLRPEN